MPRAFTTKADESTLYNLGQAGVDAEVLEQLKALALLRGTSVLDELAAAVKHLVASTPALWNNAGHPEEP